MPHEDFFEATLIEFTYWENNIEKILLKFDSFDDLPKYLMHKLDEKSPIFTIRAKKWRILDIDKNIRAHGKGIHIRIRLESI
ncbi:MAG: hypothetical protein K5790_07740 [Nitrosopumilus sp.]|uniref:hypothetical protein n=1 Tax=Nitrosopumilus sp. TaxID=2024843 RepID=UPI00247C29A3|nr:hypothetical protein [Nitrosopumilus sp.]MCV0393159.1 hypothetical protein [Nitrosopumilus sp.]